MYSYLTENFQDVGSSNLVNHATDKHKSIA